MCDSSYIWMALAQPIASRHQVKLFNKVKSCAFERGGGKQVYMTVDPSFISGEAARAKCKVPCRGIHFAAAILVYRNTSVTQAPPFCENLQRRCGAYPKGISKQGTVLRGQLHGWFLGCFQTTQKDQRSYQAHKRNPFPARHEQANSRNSVCPKKWWALLSPSVQAQKEGTTEREMLSFNQHFKLCALSARIDRLRLEPTVFLQRRLSPYGGHHIRLFNSRYQRISTFAKNGRGWIISLER